MPNELIRHSGGQASSCLICAICSSMRGRAECLWDQEEDPAKREIVGWFHTEEVLDVQDES